MKKKKFGKFPLYLVSSKIKKKVKKNLRLNVYNFILNKNSQFKIISNNNFICQPYVGHVSKNLSPKININFIGLRDDNCIFNSERSLESLQIASSICKDLARLGLPFLFINVLPEYNGIIKMAASTAYQPILLGDFIGGYFTNNIITAPAVVFILSSKKHFFFFKEAHRLNLPILSINDSDVSTDLSAFPIVVSDDSLGVQHTVLEVVSQGLIKGCLFHYADTINAEYLGGKL
jgi:ribosomal protein S2